MLSAAPGKDQVLSLTQARLLQLAALGLLQPLRRRPRRSDVVASIERMRLLQIDTIHVVARSPYLVLHARLGDYPMEWLDEALARGQLAECWAHEACFVAASDIGMHRGGHEQRAHHWAHRHAARMYREQREDMDNLLAGIRASGPVRAADFVRKDRGQEAAKPGWWEWKPEKRWLEAWFALVGRLDAKAHRSEAVFEIKSVFLESGVEPEPALVHALATVMARFARWHGTPEIRIGRTRPAALATVLRAAWRAGV
ncbi:MAG: DNA glycosylase AlkZ-like family protein [Rhodanobacter sp.]